ncbi:MAG TPA: hypothetical protein VLM85_16060 [Polyangiaceae bacterium]|nr:hypothetical protein [Polyangiaceae bacterium]
MSRTAGVVADITWAAHVGCHRSAPPVTLEVPPTAPSFAPRNGAASCIAPDRVPEGAAADVDGDGTPDRIVQGCSDVTIYLHRGDCFALLAEIDAGSPVALVGVTRGGDPGTAPPPTSVTGAVTTTKRRYCGRSFGA